MPRYYVMQRVTVEAMSRDPRSDVKRVAHVALNTDSKTAVCSADLTAEGWSQTHYPVTCEKCQKWQRKHRADLARMSAWSTEHDDQMRR